MDKKYLAVLALVAAVSAGAGYLISHPPAFPVDGIPCEAMEAQGFHIHAHLELWKGGRPVPIPAGVGIVGGCFYWLHTHTPDGILHVEAPADRQFTLSQFFAVWGSSAPQPDPGSKVWIDQGQGFQPYEGDWENIVLTDKEKISIGPPGLPEPFLVPEGL